MQGVLKKRRRTELRKKVRRQPKSKLIFSISAVPSITQVAAEMQPWPLADKTIILTPIAAEPCEVKILRLIAYSQDLEGTRLNLKGGEMLVVKESTAEIDMLIRRTAEQK